jgi:hypothetical protein
MTGEINKICPYCGCVNQSPAIYCSRCGRKLPLNNLKANKKTKLWWGLLIVLLLFAGFSCILAMVVVLRNGNGNQSIKPTSLPTYTATPVTYAEPYLTITSKVSNMTEAQLEAYLATLLGKTVNSWTGWIEEVKVVGNSYELWVDMDPPDVLFSIHDVAFPIPNDIALKLQIDQQITFSGRIVSADDFLGTIDL